MAGTTIGDDGDDPGERAERDEGQEGLLLPGNAPEEQDCGPPDRRRRDSSQKPVEDRDEPAQDRHVAYPLASWAGGQVKPHVGHRGRPRDRAVEGRLLEAERGHPAVEPEHGQVVPEERPGRRPPVDRCGRDASEPADLPGQSAGEPVPRHPEHESHRQWDAVVHRRAGQLVDPRRRRLRIDRLADVGVVDVPGQHADRGRRRTVRAVPPDPPEQTREPFERVVECGPVLEVDGAPDVLREPGDQRVRVPRRSAAHRPPRCREGRAAAATARSSRRADGRNRDPRSEPRSRRTPRRRPSGGGPP